MAGMRVSWAPRRAPQAMMLAAKRGSAKSSMRKTSIPSCCTAFTGVRKANTYGQMKYMMMAVRPMMNMPVKVVSHANVLARSLRFAPIA